MDIGSIGINALDIAAFEEGGPSAIASVIISADNKAPYIRLISPVLRDQYREQGRCVRCGQTLRPSEKPWHIHHKRWRCHGGSDTVDNLELLHKHCHHQIHYGE